MRMVELTVEVTEEMKTRLDREAKFLGMEAEDLGSLLLWAKLWEHNGVVADAVKDACFSGLAYEARADEPR